MDVTVKVMAEVLCILAIVTREINQNRASEFIPEVVLTRLLPFNRSVSEETSWEEGY